MKRYLEIIFMFVVCLASFCAGWLMSLRHQKKLSQIAPSVTAPPENRLFPKQSLFAENPLEPDISPRPLTFAAPPPLPPPAINKVEPPLPPPPPPAGHSASAGKGEIKTTSANVIKQAPPLPPPLAKPKEERPLSGLELERKKSFDKLNHEAFERIKNRQNVFNARGKFSFLINVFSKEKEAVKYVQKLRGRFPLWGFFLKPERQNIRIYLGPFLTKERAGDFIKTLPDPKPFPNYFLEMEGL